jgi:hypothetical protein
VKSLSSSSTFFMAGFAFRENMKTTDEPSV